MKSVFKAIAAALFFSFIPMESLHFWNSSKSLPEPPEVALPAPAPPLMVNRLSPRVVDPMIRSAAQKHNVKPSLVKGIVAAESAFDSNAVSSKGALGLMQLMPETAEQFGVDPLDPRQNIEGGTHYLRRLLNKYRNHRNCLARTIAAYNAGPGMVDKYRGIPPFQETRQYVQRVLAFMRQYEHKLG